MARESRPPGFDMSYRPTQSRSFGPPVRAWTPPLIYFVIATAFMAAIMLAHQFSPESWLYRYVVEGDSTRVIGAQALGLVVFLGGVAALIRTAMRGVVVHPDGLETREVLTLGWPKVRRCSWMEIDQFVFQNEAIGISLWDGTHLWLPAVADLAGLKQALQRVASARAIPVKGVLLAVPDVDEDEEEELA